MVKPWRGLFASGLVFLILFGAAACAPVGGTVKMSQLPHGGEVHGVNYAEFAHLPDWYQVYSLSAFGPPASAAHCPGRESLQFSGPHRHVSIIDCGHAGAANLAKLMPRLEKALSSVEARFGAKVHVARADFVLFGPTTGYRARNTHMMRPRHLGFGITLSFNPDKPGVSERNAVRLTAHELFHIIRHDLRRDRSGDNGGAADRAEESKADLFAYCVEYDVFGTFAKEDFQRNRFMDPHWMQGVRSAHASATSSLDTRRALLDRLGNRHRLSPKNKQWFERRCEEAADLPSG